MEKRAELTNIISKDRETRDQTNTNTLKNTTLRSGGRKRFKTKKI